MASIPYSTKIGLQQRLSAHARQRWPDLPELTVTYRAGFAYLTATLPDGDTQPLCRLRYGGSASVWGFAVYRASHHDYQDSWLPDGTPAGSPEQALDCACGLYLNDPASWT